MSFWADVVDRMQQALKLPAGNGQFPLEWATGPKKPIPDVVNDLERLLRRKGFQWEELRRVDALRPEFLAIDVRFGQLGPQGVFTMLDDDGVLEHRFRGIDNIEHAMLNPPSIGRARVAGGGGKAGGTGQRRALVL